MTLAEFHSLEFWLLWASPIFAAGGAFMAVRLELKTLRRDVDRLEGEIKHSHSRIDRLVER